MSRETSVRLRAVHRIEGKEGKKGEEVDKIILPDEIFSVRDAKERERLLENGAAVVVEEAPPAEKTAELSE